MISSKQIPNTQFVGSLETVRTVSSREFYFVLLAALLHIPLGIVLYSAGSVGLIHPIAALLVGLWWAVQPKVKIERVVIAAAYIIGAEIIWRMAGVPIFWEFGKYASALILIVALIRRGRYEVPIFPLVYLICLIPSCFVTFWNNEAGDARSIMSSEMSGPFLLFVSCWFFSNITLQVTSLRWLLCAIVSPLLSAAFATLFYTVSAEDIAFNGQSNFATSGGFGPNQVSAMLGLGAFAAILSLIVFPNPTKYKIYYVLAAILFSAQSVMTFSRGGMYNAIGAIMVVFVLSLRDPSVAVRRLVPVAIMAVIFLVLVFPYLNDFTGGSLLGRFEDTQGTHREDIVSADVQIFLENPVLGVGVGEATQMRREYMGRGAMSHTEFSRLLAEHGAFGVVALFTLVVMTISNIFRRRAALTKALFAGVTVWCFLFMMNAAMRLAAPSFLLGLSFVTVGTGRLPRRLRPNQN